MDASISFLMKIVNAEISHTRTVLAHLKEKERVLVKNDENLMRHVFSREHNLFVKSRELQENRTTMIALLAKKWDMLPEKVNLGVIVLKVEKQFQEKVAETRSLLKSLLEQVKHQNSKCEALIKMTLQMLTFSIDQLRGKFQNRQKTIYGRNSKIEEGNYLPKFYVDRKG